MTNRRSSASRCAEGCSSHDRSTAFFVGPMSVSGAKAGFGDAPRRRHPDVYTPSSSGRSIDQFFRSRPTARWRPSDAVVPVARTAYETGPTVSSIRQRRGRVRRHTQRYPRTAQRSASPGANTRWSRAISMRIRSDGARRITNRLPCSSSVSLRYPFTNSLIGTSITRACKFPGRQQFNANGRVRRRPNGNLQTVVTPGLLLANQHLLAQQLNRSGLIGRRRPAAADREAARRKDDAAAPLPGFATSPGHMQPNVESVGAGAGPAATSPQNVAEQDQNSQRAGRVRSWN